MTDIEGSTALWEAQPALMRAAMVEHDALIEEAVAAHAGQIVRPRGEGDSRFAVFERPGDAVWAVAALQRSLNAAFDQQPLAIRVRAGLHTGATDLRLGDYYGSTVNRCARIRGLGHGGQTLLSQATAELVRDDLPPDLSLIEAGTFSLKGLSRPETVYQLSIEGLPSRFPPLKSTEVVLSNLPDAPTALIGRQRETAELAALLREPGVRLVTLIGPGGTGKTRLSLEAGRYLLDDFDDGVYFVDLAPITDPDLVATTIAHALGLREGGGLPPLDNLKVALAQRNMLLILDNLEQVVAVAPKVAELLKAAPGVRVLATSRIVLNLRGEHVYSVSTLPVPPDDPSLLGKGLLAYPAVQLFVQQAQAAKPSFALTDDNASSVAGIVRRLDGLPLAIEIAAARVRLLPPAAIFKRLDDSLKLLVGGAADLPERQQTLRAAIDWSYEMLSPDEQALFGRLGIFVGSFTLESAEAVVDPNGELDLLTGVETLLNSSLVRQVETVDDEPRFAMLQTIRDFALEKLTESGELPVLRKAHANHFALEAAEKGMALFSGETAGWLARIEADHDNFRAALDTSLFDPELAPLTGMMTIFLSWFWYRYGHFHEGRAWSERSMAACAGMGGMPEAASTMSAALMAMWEGDLDVAVERAEQAEIIAAQLGDDFLQATLDMSYGVCLLNQGRDQEAYGHFLQATERFDQVGNPWAQATTLVHLANAALGLGQFDIALRWLEQAQPMTQAIGDEWQIAFCLNNFGEVARTQGRYEDARSYYEATEASYRQADAQGDHARLVHTSGYMALHDEDLSAAEANFRESLAAFRRLGNKRGMAECLAGLAAVAASGESRLAWAAKLLGAAGGQMASSGAAWWPADRMEVERTLARLRDALGEAEFDRLVAQGEMLSLEAALDLATVQEA